VRQHTQSVDIVFLAELPKFKRVVALMAIKDKQPTRHHYLALCMLDKVLSLLNSKLICCPAIVADCNSLVAWDILFLVPGR
jgi:hypothetical protein